MKHIKPFKVYESIDFEQKWIDVQGEFDVFQLMELIVFKYGHILTDSEREIAEYEDYYNPTEIYDTIRYELENLNIFNEFLTNYDQYSIEKDEADPFHWRNKQKIQNALLNGLDDLTNNDIVKVDSKIISKGATSVENYSGVLQYICADIKRSIKLTTYLKNELTEIFGVHNTRFRGEYFYYVWIVEFDGEIFNIFTANGKGVQFSIDAKDEDDKSKVCISFLRKMEELLDAIENK